MICLRCGQCCKTYCVIIIDNPELGLIEENLMFRDGSEPCKHLIGSKSGEYSCAIHDYDWYKETPCFAHTQIEQKNSNCRLGEYLLNNINLF